MAASCICDGMLVWLQLVHVMLVMAAPCRCDGMLILVLLV